MKAWLKAAPLAVELDGVQVPVALRRHARAKKMILRVDAATGDIKLTAPNHVPARELKRFLGESTSWISAERAKVAALPALGHGDMLPLFGRPHRMEYTDCSPRKVASSPGVITVGGPIDQAPARLERWLRAQAKTVISEDASAFADTLGTSFERVSIGDMKTRWGSCSSSGTLRFNWRLLLAPDAVRRYVAAHEVAHLLEMNHSPRFWHHVETLVADYRSHRKWLRTEGRDLMRLRFRNHQTGG